MTCTIF